MTETLSLTTGTSSNVERNDAISEDNLNGCCDAFISLTLCCIGKSHKGQQVTSILKQLLPKFILTSKHNLSQPANSPYLTLLATELSLICKYIIYTIIVQ